jgi:hypothetical protein
MIREPDAKALLIIRLEDVIDSQKGALAAFSAMFTVHYIESLV